MNRNLSHFVSYDQNAPKRPVNLSLNADLLAQVRKITPNLSSTVESLLCDYLSSEKFLKDEERKKIDMVLDAINDFHAKHGFISDEFSNL